jgi:hypothetical protein
LGLNKGLQRGLIAQDVEKLMPELVKEAKTPDQYDSLGTLISQGISYKVLDYTGLIPILIQGYQEQQTAIDSLKEQVKQLAEMVSNCCTAASTGITDSTATARMGVTLDNTSAIILDQNVPNPFAEETQINFIIPDDVQNAKIIFYEKTGRVMKIAVIKERGKGSMTVFAENLSSGIYSYSLVADGRVIDTKKMVRQK